MHFASTTMSALAAAFLIATVPSAEASDAAKPPLRVIGTMKAELDYRQRTWYLTARGDESRSGFTGEEDTSRVMLFGNADPEGYGNVKDSLRIEFNVILMEGELVANDVDLRYTPENLANPYTAQRESATFLRVDEVKIEGDVLRISGSFQSELDFQPGLSSLIGGDVSASGGAGLIAGALTEAKRRTRDLEDGRFIALLPRKQ
ncbi:MAG: hypothetical protein AAFU72_00095 [Pseudomonadota bacterium]